MRKKLGANKLERIPFHKSVTEPKYSSKTKRTKSTNNKMNEANPHRNWARRVLSRAQAYGVIKNESEFVQLFIESSAEKPLPLPVY